MIKNRGIYKIDQEPTQNELNSIYINISGIFELISKSKLNEAKEFQYWINNDILPTLNKQGYYIVNDKKELTSFKQEPNKYVEFSSNNLILQFKEAHVIYLGYIGTVTEEGSDSDFGIGQVAYKYGISRRMYERDCEHINL